MNGDYVNSLEEFDTTGMDSVWLDIKISWNVNDDSRIELSKMEAARNEVVSVQGVGMSPYEALYRKRCRSPLYQNEVAEC
ncbi:hypothetical protein AgCh_004877 [Apium graveolens]